MAVGINGTRRGQRLMFPWLVGADGIHRWVRYLQYQRKRNLCNLTRAGLGRPNAKFADARKPQDTPFSRQQAGKDVAISAIIRGAP